MKVILINPFAHTAKGTNEATVYPPLGIAYIAALLEKNGHNCKIVDANILHIPPDDVFSLIKEEDPDMVCISINITTALVGTALAKRVKEELNKNNIAIRIRGI